MNTRYFVTIFAPDSESALRLPDYGVDLVHGSARRIDDKGSSVEALVTLDEVSRLVDGGYRVLVEEESSKRARATSQVVGLERWLREMEE